MIRAFLWPVKLIAGYALLGALAGVGLASYILSGAYRTEENRR